MISMLLVLDLLLLVCYDVSMCLLAVGCLCCLFTFAYVCLDVLGCFRAYL